MGPKLRHPAIGELTDHGHPVLQNRFNKRLCVLQYRKQKGLVLSQFCELDAFSQYVFHFDGFLHGFLQNIRSEQVIRGL